MRSRLPAALGLTLALSAGEGCVLIWSYGSFHDQPGSGGSRGSRGSGGGGATGGQGTGGTICLPEPDAGDAGEICCGSDCGTCVTCTVCDDAGNCVAPGPGG